MNEHNKEWFVIDSHRGAFKEGLLENSIPAFEQSYKEGANVMECDLRMAKDGNIILIHNNTIDHIASFAISTPEEKEFGELPVGKVKKHTLAYLKSLKFENDAQILSLPELLVWLKEKKVGAQLELKVSCGEKILQNILEADMPWEELNGPIVITSFNFLLIKKLLNEVKKYDIPLYVPNKSRGLAFGFQAIKTGSFYGKSMLRKFKKWGIWGGMTYYKNMPIRRLKYAHEMGVKFCPRVPDNVKLINKYLDAGVDGFETDNVPLIRECCMKKGIPLWNPEK